MKYLLAFLATKAVLANLIGAPDPNHLAQSLCAIVLQLFCLYLLKQGKGYRIYMLQFSLMSLLAYL
jgi:hypothetical protein